MGSILLSRLEDDLYHASVYRTETGKHAVEILHPEGHAFEDILRHEFNEKLNQHTRQQGIDAIHHVVVRPISATDLKQVDQ